MSVTAKSFFQLTRDEVNAANERFLAYLIDNPPKVVQWTGAELGAKLGIRLLSDSDEDKHLIPWLTYRGKQYIATKNKANRPPSVPNMRNLLKFFMSGRWALNGETLIFDENGMCCSAQHRAAAAFFYSLETGDTTTKFPFIIVEGVPVELIDSIDTGKSRDNKDILTRHVDIFRESALRTVSGYKPEPKTVSDRRKKLSAMLNTVCRLLYLRTDAKDIKASSTGYKQEEIFEIMSKFEPSPTISTRPEGESFDVVLEDLCELVYNLDTGLTGKSGTLSKQLGLADIATAIVLYSNRKTEPIPSNVDGRRYALPDSFEVDLQFAENFCKAASDATPTGFMHPLYSYLHENYSGKVKLDPQYYFAALVNAIKWFADNHKVVENSTTGENGQTITTSIVVCPPLPGHGIPPQQPKMSAQEKKRNPWKWPHFGGIDIGYVKPVAKKSEDIAEDDSDE